MDVEVILCIVLAVLASALYMGARRRRKLPPGPVGLPFLGYYPFLGNDAVKTMTDLGKKYGSVFGLYIGQQYLVVLSDWEAMTEAYNQAQTLNRPPALFAAVPHNFGVVGKNGAEWSKVRRLMTKAIKDIGLHRTRWAELIREEVSDVVERITRHGTGPLDVRSFFAETFANSIMTLILGKRLHAGHPLTKLVSRSVDHILEQTPTLGILNFAPRLLKILQTLGFEKEINIEEEVQEFTKLVSDTVDEKMRNPDQESEDSFIDLFYREFLSSYKKDPASSGKEYIESTLKGNVIALLAGGSETSRTTIIFTLIAMADHPEEQAKVQEELDRVLGQDGCLEWSDRGKVPYTYAALLESMRWQTIGPMSTLRMASEDIRVQGYHIPKGTFMSFNTRDLHNDTRYWDEPEKFIPKRFLSDDGMRVNSEAKSYAPFSYGKRMCPGKLIANIENIQYFSTLMRKFKVLPSDGKKTQYDGRTGLTYSAYNIDLRFIPRQ